MTSHDGRSRKATSKTQSTKKQKMKSLKFFGIGLATILPTGAWRLVLLLATAVSLMGYLNPASAATFNVTVGVAYPLGFTFVPRFVTIHPGDQVNWTWASGGPQHYVRPRRGHCPLPDARWYMEFWTS